MDQALPQEDHSVVATGGAMTSATQAGSPSAPRTSIPPSSIQLSDPLEQTYSPSQPLLRSSSPSSASQQAQQAPPSTVPSYDRVSSSTVSSSPPTGAPSAAPNQDDEQIVFTKRAIPQPRQQSPSPAYPTSAPSARSTFGGPSESSSAEARRSLHGPSSFAAAGATTASPLLSGSSSVTPSESWEVPSQPASLLSQILSTHAHKLSLIHSGPGSGGGGPHSAGPASPLSSVPNSTASSPVGSAAQLHGIFRRRGSDGASDLLGSGLSRVGEEDVLGAATRVHGRTEPMSTTSSSRYPSPERSTSPSEIAVSLDGGLPSVEPATAPPLLVDPTVRTLPQDPAPAIVRSIIASGPPSSVVTASAILPPVRKASNLTFAVTTVCARPEAMGALPGPDRKLHESESDDEDDDQDAQDEEDDDEDDEDEDDDGYCEDDEGDATTDTDDEDEDGDDLDASPAERKRYRYKRHSLFGESDSDEESLSDADADSTHQQAGKRDSVLSNFSVGACGPEPAEPTFTRKASLSRSTSLLRHRRSLSLKGRAAKKATSGPIPPVPPVPTLRFPTPLVARRDHSDFPRSPVPASTVRGGGGYSPRVRQSVRVGAVSSGGEKSASRSGAVIGRDDFLPTHLKSEDGKNKERDRDRDRDRDSTTDAGGASGRCSRHRSPPPSSAGRDKMREHHARQRSRSAALSGEDRSGPSRRGSADPGPAQAVPTTSRPPPILPPPILLRSSTGLPTPRGDLTPVFFSEAEEAAGPSRPSPPLSPTAPARPHFQIPSHPHPPTSARPFPLATPPPSRRVSSSLSERRASLSVVCSAFRRPSDDLALDPAMTAGQATLALDGTPSTPFSATQGAGLLTQSLQKALGTTSVPTPPSPATAAAIRPFSPPPSAPSSFGPNRSALDRPAQPGGSRRRMSQPTATDEGAGEKPIKARPIACPRRLSGGGWMDGG